MIIGTLDVSFDSMAPHPLVDEYERYPRSIVGFSARTSVSRSSFGMTADPGEKGDLAILSIEVEGWHKP